MAINCWENASSLFKRRFRCHCHPWISRSLLFCLDYPGPTEGITEPGVSPSKRLCDISPINCSPDIDSEHLNFDDDNHIHEDPHSSSASDSSSSSSSLNTTPMVLGEIHRHPFSICRPKFTPPRSPLAGPSTTQNHSSRTIGSSPSCFTFAPVRDWWPSMVKR